MKITHNCSHCIVLVHSSESDWSCVGITRSELTLLPHSLYICIKLYLNDCAVNDYRHVLDQHRYIVALRGRLKHWYPGTLMSVSSWSASVDMAKLDRDLDNGW